MTEVKAVLKRGPVCLAGQAIECYVTFLHPLPNFSARSQSSRDAVENLAWASAQIHCLCSVDNTKVCFPVSSQLSQEEAAIASGDTSFVPCRGEKGHVVFSTKPKILFCDLKLMAGESKTFIYRDSIPSDAPPSYKGQAVKYCYKITIGTQRLHAGIKLLRIPLRVLVLSGLIYANVPADSDELQVAPTNPFLHNEQRESPLDIALHVLENITARRNPAYYNVTSQNGRVVRFCLLKSSYRLGEDIIGTFDFSNATVPCVQFSTTLQSIEEINEDCRANSKKGTFVISHSKHHEFCLHLNQTQMVLPIPLTVTPTFLTNVVTLHWRLHFEFVTTTTDKLKMEIPSNPEQSIMWRGPSMLDIQTMVWDLPIQIFPAHPFQVTQGLQFGGCNYLNLK